MSQVSDFYNLINPSVNVTVVDSSLATYSSSTAAVQITQSASTSGASAVNIIGALLPAGTTGSNNTKTVNIERIAFSMVSSTGSGKPLFEVRLGMASGFVGGTSKAILSHNQGDAASSMQFLQAPTSIGNTVWVPFSKVINPVNQSNDFFILTRKDFPGGKPIVLRNGQPEGIYLHLFNVVAGTWPNDNYFTVAFTWSEQ